MSHRNSEIESACTKIKELIIEKNQFILIDYLLNKSDTYKELRVE